MDLLHDVVIVTHGATDLIGEIERHHHHAGVVGVRVLLDVRCGVILAPIVTLVKCDASLPALDKLTSSADFR